MAKKPDTSAKPGGKFTPRIINKKARFAYEFLEKTEAGIVLLGTEVKSLRNGRASLDEAFCRITGSEIFLVGCNIPIYVHGNINNHQPDRTRKLLLHRRQISQLQTKLDQKGLTLIPSRIYFSGPLVKVEIVLARGRKTFDKREKIKDRQLDREMQAALKRRR